MESLSFAGLENRVFWAVVLIALIAVAILVGVLSRKRFGMKLGLAFTLLSVTVTSVSVFFYYNAMYDSLYASTTARIKDIGRTGLFLFDDEIKETILRIHRESEQKSKTRDAAFLSKITRGNSDNSLSDEDIAAILQDKGFIRLVQVLRKIKNGTREHVVLTAPIPQEPLDPNDLPVIRYANVFVPIPESPSVEHVKWIADTDCERLDANKNGKIDDDEQASSPGMIYNYGDASAEIKGALAGEVTATKGYIFDTYGVWVSAFFPIYHEGKVIAVHSMDLDARREVNLVRKLWFQSLGIIALSFVLSIVFSILMSKYLARPIMQMSQAARRIRAHDYSTRITMRRKDEFANLKDAFNEMAAEVGAYAQTLEQRVAERTSELEQARKETGRILATVSDALFLLTPEGTLRGNYSRAMEDIFPGQRIAGANLMDLLRPVIAPQTLLSVQTYLKLMFDSSRPDVTLKGLNPLARIQFSDGSGIWVSSNFQRIHSDGKVTELLGIFSDITPQIRLQEELGQEKRRSEIQTKLVLDLLRVAPKLLRMFLSELEADLPEVKQSISDQNRLTVMRRLHTLKGNAASLGLDMFAEALHVAEEAAEKSSSDPTPYSAAIATVEQIHKESSALSEKIRDAATIQVDENFIVQAIRGIFERRGHKIDLVTTNFDAKLIASKHERMIRDALIQFARNTIAHGWESPQERESNGKQSEMIITLSPRELNGHIEVTYSDDGKGLDVEKIRKRGISLGLLSETDPVDGARAVELIFHPGFSTRTSSEISIDAGRGVGLDLVRAAVEEAGGHIRTASNNQRTEFTIELPV